METTTENLPHLDEAMVRADEIRWSPVQIDSIEDLDVLGLTETETFAYIAQLQEHARWRGRLLSEALAMVDRQSEQLARATHLVQFQRQQIQAMRERIAA